MAGAGNAAIVDYLVRSRDAIQAALDDAAFLAAVATAAGHIAAALAAGGKVLLAGNGGSAADAQHIAGELVTRLNYDRPPLAAVALTTDSSVLTGAANDYGYERVFERQVLALGRPGDVLVAISTSGRSPNILRAIDAARGQDLVVIGLTGRNGGDMAARCDLCLFAPVESTQLVQQLHIAVGHVVCALVEASLFPQPRGAAQ